jgi:hypothetical protein
MNTPHPFPVVAGVAGLVVECRTDDLEVAHRFSGIVPSNTPVPGLPRQIYEVCRDIDDELVVKTDHLCLARTPHPGNAVAAIELDLRRAAETYHARSIWLHAAALTRDDGSALLCIGASGAGKSTAAFALLAAGWQYLADDAVLLDPVDRRLIGLGWSLRLAALPAPRETLIAAGFTIASDKWVCSDGRRSVSSFRLTPPPASVWSGAAPLRLDRCLFLERGPLAIETLSAGQALIRLWPQRVARSDGREPWDPGTLAARLAGISFATLRTERVEQLAPAVAEWMRDDRKGVR